MILDPAAATEMDEQRRAEERQSLEALASDLEKIVDRAIMRTPPGRTFRTMVGQGERLRAAAAILAERYERLGWSQARTEPDARGVTWIILDP
jgi:hypothetical protein